MRYIDTAMISGGRADIASVLLGPHRSYPPDFRVEKPGAARLERFSRTGFAESVLRRATFTGQTWTARFGHHFEPDCLGHSSSSSSSSSLPR